MSARARAYQEQVTGHTSTEGYIVRGVKFDGFRDGVLIDAKGPGYARFTRDRRFRQWWTNSPTGGLAMLRQATCQAAVANGMPIEWTVAEPEAVEAITRFLGRSAGAGITMRYVPPHSRLRDQRLHPRRYLIRLIGHTRRAHSNPSRARRVLLGHPR
jgi:hypothetical protein